MRKLKNIFIWEEGRNKLIKNTHCLRVNINPLLLKLSFKRYSLEVLIPGVLRKLRWLFKFLVISIIYDTQGLLEEKVGLVLRTQDTMMDSITEKQIHNATIQECQIKNAF